MGFIIMVVMCVYLALSVFAVTWAVGHAKKNGLSVKKCGWGAALVMYLIPFWDWIPTVVAHKYYCEKEAGFWVYKTLDQWKAENPGVMEGLVANKGAPSTRAGDDTNFTDTYFLNQRINKAVTEHRIFSALPVFRHEQTAVDAKNNQVVARYVDFRSGYPNGLAGIVPRSAGLAAGKFWLVSEHCGGGESNYGKFLLIKRTFQGAEK